MKPTDQIAAVITMTKGKRVASRLPKTTYRMIAIIANITGDSRRRSRSL